MKFNTGYLIRSYLAGKGHAGRLYLTKNVAENSCKTEQWMNVPSVIVGKRCSEALLADDASISFCCHVSQKLKQ